MQIFILKNTKKGVSINQTRKRFPRKLINRENVFIHKQADMV